MDGGVCFMYVRCMTRVGRLDKRTRFQQIHLHPPFKMLACVYCVRDAWEFSNLAMPFWRWYLNDAAGAEICIGGRAIPIEPGKIYLIPPHTPYGSHTANSVGMLYMHFDLDWRTHPHPDGAITLAMTQQERRLAARLRKHLQNQSDLSGLHTGFCSHALICTALEAIPDNLWLDQPMNPRVTQAIQTIRENYPRAIQTEDLAGAAGMNASAFCRLFSATCGIAPHRFLNRMRLENACVLLQDDELSIDEIAERVGFCDRFHLSRCFLKELQTTPAAFRKSCVTRLSFPHGN